MLDPNARMEGSYTSWRPNTSATVHLFTALLKEKKCLDIEEKEKRG